MEVLTSLEVLEQVLTLLAAVLIVDIDRQPFEIEIDSIAEEQDKDDRHQNDNDEAAPVVQNLHDLFSRNGQQTGRAHNLRSSADSRPVVSETNTSSRLGRIFSMRLTVML